MELHLVQVILETLSKQVRTKEHRRPSKACIGSFLKSLAIRSATQQLQHIDYSNYYTLTITMKIEIIYLIKFFGISSNI